MLVAGGLFLLGGGLTAAGMLWSGLYDIGIGVLIVASIGIVVRAGDLARVLLTRRRPPGDWDGHLTPHGHGGGELP